MISFLASPKPFVGDAKALQYRAIRSWQSTTPDAEVILYGSAAGIEEAAVELGARFVRDVACAPSGVPYFNAIVEHATRGAKFERQVFVNCDILLAGMRQAFDRVSDYRYLLVGQRIDLARDVHFEICREDWLRQLRQLVEARLAELHGPTGIDYFGFTRGTWSNLPSIVIGRAGYDNAILAHCFRNEIPVIDATSVVAALHQFHGYSHVSGGVAEVRAGVDARSNYRQAGGARSATMISDARYVLEDSGPREWPCRGDRLRQLELNWRFVKNRRNRALALRLLWRLRHAFGAGRAQSYSTGDVVASLEACFAS